MAIDPQASFDQPLQDPNLIGDIVLLKLSVNRATCDVIDHITEPHPAPFYHMAGQDVRVPQDTFLNMTYMGRVLTEAVSEINRLTALTATLNDQVAALRRELDTPKTIGTQTKAQPRIKLGETT